jgi:hypothetical protein
VAVVFTVTRFGMGRHSESSPANVTRAASDPHAAPTQPPTPTTALPRIEAVSQPVAPPLVAPPPSATPSAVQPAQAPPPARDPRATPRPHAHGAPPPTTHADAPPPASHAPTHATHRPGQIQSEW